MKHTVVLFLVLISIFTTSCKQNKRLKVACIGSSFTRGYGLQKKKINSYPAQLQEITVGDWDIRNFGSTGTSVIRKSSLSYWDTLALKEAIEFNPDIVIMEFGSTSLIKRENWLLMHDHLLNDFSDLVLLFKGLPSHPTIVLIVPAFYHDGESDEEKETYYKYLLKINKEIALFHELQIINLHTSLCSENDFFHAESKYLSVEGSKEAAKKIYSFLVKYVLNI